eukprot:COSAG06_NODE_6282_length_2999_cov_19.107241_1_plen_117_part_00
MLSRPSLGSARTLGRRVAETPNNLGLPTNTIQYSFKLIQARLTTSTIFDIRTLGRRVAETSSSQFTLQYQYQYILVAKPSEARGSEQVCRTDLGRASCRQQVGDVENRFFAFFDDD